MSLPLFFVLICLRLERRATFFLILSGLRSRVEDLRRHSIGGNAKPTFGILNVIPGRDLFSS
jgi:hypothetical protein